MNIAIIGSRDAFKELYVRDELDRLYEKDWTKIISGGAPGVDTFAKNWAKDNDIPIEIIRPKDPKVKSDYFKRNIEIVKKADKVVAFWDKSSKGTAFTVEFAIEVGKPVFILPRVEGQNVNIR